MKRIMANLLEAMMANGEDGQELVEGSLMAIHQFVKDNAGIPLDDEWKRLTKILTTGAE